MPIKAETLPILKGQSKKTAPAPKKPARKILSAVHGGLIKARLETDKLFSLLKTQAFYEKPIPQYHRIIFYLGHLEAYDGRLLAEALNLKPFNRELDKLFSTAARFPHENPVDWPSHLPFLDEIYSYSDRMRRALDQKIEALTHQPLEIGSERDENSLETLLSAAVEYRLLHAEILTTLIHQIPSNWKISQPQLQLAAQAPVDFQMVEIPEGNVRLGFKNDKTRFTFVWDNEKISHTVALPAFKIDRYKVTQSQYLQFVQAGGYKNPRWWTSEDWDWKCAQGLQHPLFWKNHGGRWYYRSMFNEIPLPPDWPVFVSHAEASAYANWAGKALPTEAQWQRAAYGGARDFEKPYPWGFDNPAMEHGYFTSRRWDPFPVSSFPRNQSTYGVAGLIANGWEWTCTLLEAAPGLSTPFSDGTRYVLKGGSHRTAGALLRRSFRGSSHPRSGYAYTGFRCVSR